MIAGPATLTVLIIVLVLLVAGVVLLKVSSRQRRQRQQRGGVRGFQLCRHCQHENPGEATYCARCGRGLEIRDS